MSVSWIASHTLNKEASRAQMRLMPENDPRPLEQRLDELFSSSPYAYRDQVRRIMATAIHEILLAAGFDARLIADDYVPNTNVEVFDRTAASEHPH